MYTLAEAQQLIEKHIETLSIPDEPAGLYDPVRYVLSLGGKRIRPALMLLACELYSGGVESALMPAMAIEIFHNFTLLHDDIMDRSDMRRGHPAVHIKYGENVALLSGDVMSILASRLINKAPGVVLSSVHDVFTHTAMQVCEGQQLDMNFESELTVSEEEYMEMIELKTAVLIAASLKIGAILGGASQVEANELYDYGRNLGLAFQLQDDLLDTYGDEQKTGKKRGTDIVDNKKTFLMINALERADAQQRERLEFWLKSTRFDRHEKVAEVTRIYDELGIRALAGERIKDYYNKAIENLKHLGRPEECKQELYQFAAYLMGRDY
ncbi:MAG: isoprenyl synthetase [Bacteroidetes bacterium]|nr:MAG: isoprenyl synthetase [Bacteroidota bacterium]